MYVHTTIHKMALRFQVIEGVDLIYFVGLLR
jgi:hypothetical protein